MTDRRAMKAMQASMVTAADTQVRQIVALVEAMAQRGEADRLRAPLRSRLAKLRPPRPVGFTRLLFTPIDPLVVPAPAWRRDGLLVPRTALTPIANALRAALPQERAKVAEESRLCAMSPSRLMEVASGLWLRAAAVIDATTPPSGWAEATGLTEADYPPIAAAITAVLSVAADIQALTMLQDATSENALRIILGRTAPRGSRALSAVVVVLLARLAGSGRILSLATEAAGSNPPRAVDDAVEHTLDRLQAAIDADAAVGPDVGQAALDAGRLVGLLREMEPSAATRPDRKRRLEHLRRGADRLCRQRFAAALQDELLAQLEGLPTAPDDAAVESLEVSARGLRRFETNARQLGSGERYDALLRGCLAPFQRSDSPLGLEERVRLVEILVGAEKALALMQ